MKLAVSGTTACRVSSWRLANRHECSQDVAAKTPGRQLCSAVRCGPRAHELIRSKRAAEDGDNPQMQVQKPASLQQMAERLAEPCTRREWGCHVVRGQSIASRGRRSKPRRRTCWLGTQGVYGRFRGRKSPFLSRMMSSPGRNRRRGCVVMLRSFVSESRAVPLRSLRGSLVSRQARFTLVENPPSIMKLQTGG